MVRGSDDAWNVDESVGATALGAAAVRAFESASASPVFVDPYAQRFLDAIAEQGMTVRHGGRRPEEFVESDPALAEFVAAMTNFAVARTKSFDDFFVTSANDGVTQFVSLAAGLDTRAWRLAELHGCAVFEIDQPGVLEFKVQVLGRSTAPLADYTPVPVDLRHDWPAALEQAGFATARATAWAAEGLLPYLPPDAQAALFERIGELSAPGSRLIVDVYRLEFYGDTALADTLGQIDRAARAGAAEEERIYQKDLLFNGPRMDVAAWLTERGWEVTAVPALSAMTGLGRAPGASVNTAAVSSDFVEARH